MPNPIPAIDRFWSMVDAPSRYACWWWTGYDNDGRGYGRIRVNSSRRVMAHRFAYESLVGPIPPGYVVDHLCRNPRCVNPDHLEAVTPQTNTLRGQTIAAAWAKRAACPAGHPLDGTVRDGKARRCLTCHREESRAWRARRQANAARV